ncbi:hypothetical protein BDM02DRAFT_3113673 [Thelephora ganbajun]|uniref:Uncharacterized protein n=1 Tax=Thelephora ganbajun TaxID=370292 RepID=A0ACB6ZJ68_THEGA|nr:hypothetical protein BDM02DRAFT_3113673 [Thelephora ganbajun]
MLNAPKFLLSLSTVTLFHNLLDCPVGSIPVTRVGPELDALPKDRFMTTSSNAPPPKEPDKPSYRKGWGYDADVIAGWPVGMQLVGERWEDEKVVEMMRVVDAILGERGFLRDKVEAS